jgi:hypothetical protein
MARFPGKAATAIAVVALLVAEPARAQTGDATDALPGLAHVPVLQPASRGLAVAGSAGYGYTEGVLGTGDAYSRASGSLAVSYQPASFFAAALRFDGRYDTDTGGQHASGAVGDPRLELRGMTAIGSGGVRLGGQLGIWTPGGTPPSVPARAITPDLSALFTYAPPGRALTLTSRVGIRWDNSSQSVPNLSTLALPDRVELGLNSASAVLIGVGDAYRLTPRLELLADVTWDVLFGADAPPAVDDPILLSAGARYQLDANGKVQLEGILTVSPSGRPTVSATAPLVDIEPRVSLLFGIIVRPFAEAPPPESGVPASSEPPVSTPAPPPAATRAKVAGRALTEDGHGPLAHAHVVVTGENGVKQETDTDQDGRFETGEMDFGPVTVVITGTGYKPVTKTLVVSATPAPLDIRAAPALPEGEVRVVVHDLTGKPPAACRVRLEPGGVEVSLGPDGMFHADVLPGTYDVLIRAPGYTDQKRHIVVDRDAVVLLNVEMRRRGP